MQNPDPDNVTRPPDGRPYSEQPRWRQDFSIDWPRDEYVSRRELVKFIVLTSLAFVAGQFAVLWESLRGGREQATPPAPIAKLDDVPAGSARVFNYPKGSPPRLLVRLEDGTLAAYDQQCTHLLCPVLPELEQGKLHCPCHNGLFDARTGHVLAGPPPRPLPRVTLEVRDGVIWATGIEERAA